jgi:ribose transport system substrate-binding protein
MPVRRGGRDVRALVVVALGALSLAVSACGSSGSSTSTSSPAGSTTAGKADGAKARAEAALKPYLGHPSPFPVTTPLEKRPTGERLAYVECPAPLCALLKPFIASAAKTMGVNLYTVKGGFSPEELSKAWNTVVQQKPAGAISPATEAVLIHNQVEQLQKLGIPVVSTGVIDTKKYGIAVEVAGTTLNALAAKLQADYIYEKLGDKANAVFYYTPELGFTRAELPAFKSEMAALCPKCTVRFVKVPVASLGTTSPKLIVSDLQSHPDTNASAVSQADNYNGLPAAMKLAGIKTGTDGVMLVSYSGTPVTHQYVKEGSVTADLALDVPALGYTLVDAVARAVTKQEITPDVAHGLVPLQFLEQKDMTFDYSKGWTAYPDEVDRWKKLWGIGN